MCVNVYVCVCDSASFPGTFIYRAITHLLLHAFIYLLFHSFIHSPIHPSTQSRLSTLHANNPPASGAKQNKTLLPALKLSAHLRVRTVNKYSVTEAPVIPVTQLHRRRRTASSCSVPESVLDL